MICDRLEQTLGGDWPGLYGEVVTHDCYHVRQVKFQPDVVVDVGANVGTFSRFVMVLFPHAQIYAVEPDPLNCAHFRKFTTDDRIHLIPKALGHGQIYHGTTARNGSGETYLSVGLGYPEALMREAVEIGAGMVMSSVPSITLGDLFLSLDLFETSKKVVLKIDCEGAENTIWDDPISMAALVRADYVAMELHSYAMTGKEHPEVLRATEEGLLLLTTTHDCQRQGVHFWATKRPL